MFSYIIKDIFYKIYIVVYNKMPKKRVGSSEPSFCENPYPIDLSPHNVLSLNSKSRKSLPEWARQALKPD